MKPATLALVCAAIALFSVACTQTAPTNSSAPSAAQSPTTPAAPKATPDAFAAARANYAKDCESCHGDKGVGGLVKIDNKRLKVPSFKADHALKHSDEDYTRQITKGGDGMPAFKDKLKPEEIAELIRFVRKEFQGR